MEWEKEMVNETLSQSLVESVDSGGVVWKMPSHCYFKLFAWNAPRNINLYGVGVVGIMGTEGSQKKIHNFHSTLVCFGLLGPSLLFLTLV